MLNTVNQLSREIDGRYATADELQEIKDYLSTADRRISAYKKIRDVEQKIIDEIEARMLKEDAYIFRKGSKDLTGNYQYDTKNIMRCTAAAVLMDTLDRLRDDILLWQATVVKSFKVEHLAYRAYQLMPDVMRQYLNEEEMKLVMPALYLNQTIFDG
ncbi:MAG: allophycocyanin [Cyanobacteria bacterium J06639_1]